MRKNPIIKANLKKYRNSLFGLFILVGLVSMAVSTVMTLWINSNRYIESEIQRVGFGDITVWVSNIEDISIIKEDIDSLDEIESVQTQKILFANYEINSHQSDSEGQLILYNKAEADYRFYNSELTGYVNSPIQITEGQVYVPASFVSIFEAKKGDIVEVVAARNGIKHQLKIAGFFEDPYAGSSMIGLKSLLISGADYSIIEKLAHEAGIDSLARSGSMVHISKKDEANLTSSEINEIINVETSLGVYTEFTHSAETMEGFMLLLENIFSGILAAFSSILLIVTFIVLGHIIGSTIEHETSNISILKTVGYTNNKLIKIQAAQYAVPVLSGIVAGNIVSLFVSPSISLMTLTSVGVLFPTRYPAAYILPMFVIIILTLGIFIFYKTSKTKNISPIAAIRNDKKTSSKISGMNIKIRKKGLFFWSAVRQISANKKNYIGILSVSLLLVFFVSSVGRINSWLGANGEGLMDAFNPADLHLGIQIFSDRVSEEDVEKLISGYSPILDRYDLAMPTVSLNGVDYTANVITEPDRFHVLTGKTCRADNEVVLTEFLAKDLGVEIGGSVTLSVGRKTGEYIVSGIYQCANDMGANLGLSKEGYLKLGQDDFRIWCMHYFIENPEMNKEIMSILEQRYKADVHVHENAWPGLYGILKAMKLLIVLLYAMSAVFILIVVSLVSHRLLTDEQKDMSIFKSVGFSSSGLRRVFLNRFLIVTALGSLLGIVLSAYTTDYMVDFIMRFAGISGFDSHPNISEIMLPLIAVTGLFAVFAWMYSNKIKKLYVTQLIDE